MGRRCRSVVVFNQVVDFKINRQALGQNSPSADSAFIAKLGENIHDPLTGRPMPYFFPNAFHQAIDMFPVAPIDHEVGDYLYIRLSMSLIKGLSRH